MPRRDFAGGFVLQKYIDRDLDRYTLPQFIEKIHICSHQVP
jgi:hypothetical protein